MAVQIDGIVKKAGDVESSEPLMVTITLEEYRSLIEQNTRCLCDLERLYEDNYRLKRLVGEDK